MQLSKLLQATGATLAFLPSGVLAKCVIGLTFNGNWVPNNRFVISPGGKFSFIANYVIIPVRLDESCHWHQDLAENAKPVIIPSGYGIKSCDEGDFVNNQCQEPPKRTSIGGTKVYAFS
ncbi:hypothetical protein MGG_17255 [Pyricularia oryzae 70-15]|uniref:Uncharacterized protein n=1 Tax=Pyricularia oryzae (strain 70-15 / ATCC MYA-4617 / FGSC 8958) TaxID=242507 RepID=G4N9M1_PYRO7|nr:uncharacterized protein MGG_17255 [Pyricularia oryzae 70-15]EHA51209.1 hypothetical protein MGG_17255 [Pyricularia oryzae 70-15]KAI7908398.1 hypothetical protein M9X92_012213 [Pyricularia oryzae]KAI7909665.1 hypothetical protein M0657_011745 [Pyricularia oryzae]